MEEKGKRRSAGEKGEKEGGREVLSGEQNRTERLKQKGERKTDEDEVVEAVNKGQGEGRGKATEMRKEGQGEGGKATEMGNEGKGEGGEGDGVGE